MPVRRERAKSELGAVEQDADAIRRVAAAALEQVLPGVFESARGEWSSGTGRNGLCPREQPVDGLRVGFASVCGR
jgi:hypothetical protein